MGLKQTKFLYTDDSNIIAFDVNTGNQVTRQCSVAALNNGNYGAAGLWMNVIDAYTVDAGTSYHVVWKQRMLRFTIKTDSAGATALALNFGAYTGGCSTLYGKVITSSSTDYPTGWTKLTRSGSTWSMSGLKLLPNTTYYLWVKSLTSDNGSTLGAGTTDTPSVLKITASGTYGTAGDITVTGSEIGSDITLSYAADTSGATYTVTTTIDTTAGGTYTETLQYYADDDGGTDTLTWTPNLQTYAEAVTDSSTVSATITVYTYYGSTLAGTATKTVTLSFPSSIAPTIGDGTFTILPTTNSTLSGYVQSRSGAVVTFDSSAATLMYNAEVANWSVQVGTATAVEMESTDTSYTSSALTEDVTITCTLTDSRGMSSTYTEDITILPYLTPAMTATAIRTDSNHDADDEGTYIYINISSLQYAALYDDSTAQNTMSVGVYLKQGSGSYTLVSTLTDSSPTASGTNLIASMTHEITNVADDVFYVKLIATDLLGNTDEKVFTIPSASWFLHAYAGGEGAAFGKAATTADLLDIGDWDLKANGALLSTSLSGLSSAITTGLNEHLVVTSETSSSMTITGTSASGGTGSFAISNDGYTPVGIVGWSCSRGYANVYQLYISNSSIYYGIYNLSSSAITMTITVNVLWRKDM